jgi:hypothetical protein
VSELRWERRNEVSEREAAGKQLKSGESRADMVYENAILFMRDCLITREFNNAVKSGDSGRILIILKIWALSFRGSGRTKYAHEMLHVIHNFTHVWPKEIRFVSSRRMAKTHFKSRHIVLNNWLVNPTGKENSWVEVDLMQEHMNF